MKKVYLILLIVLSTIVYAQYPHHALKTIMEVEYIPQHYQLGTGMIGLGDINSDGKPDFAVSARAIKKTFIYYGGEGVLDDTVDIEIEGGGAMEKGDLNGDGALDLVIYMRGDSTTGYYNRLAVYLGRKDSIVKIGREPTLYIEEEELSSRFGETFAIGDLNGDGYDDLVVGAWDYDIPRGKVYLYYGKPNINNIPDETEEGEKTDSAYSSYGFRLNIADINGDEINDLVIGADRRRYVDDIWITDGFLDIFLGGNDFNFSSDGYVQRLEKSNSGFEYIQYSTLCDINADEISDISYAKGDSAYFFLGNPDSISYTPNLILVNPDTSFYSSFGSCFDIGDVNNDGKNDCAFRLAPGGYATCLVVYLGDTVPDPIAGRCKSFVSGSPFSPIVALGDVNGDGVNDFGTVAPQNPLSSQPQNGYFVILSGDSSFVTSVPQEETVPRESYLEQNYPNPFNPTTIIEYYLPTHSKVRLVIYNSLGQEVETLVSEFQTSGEHRVQFNASGYSTGVYFYSLITVNNKLTQKMLLVK